MDSGSQQHPVSVAHILFDEAASMFSDVTFRTHDQADHGDLSETPAHKCLLAATSPVFRSMFTSGLREQDTSVVEISDLSTASLRAFLRLVYTGHLDDEELCEHGLDVLSACHKYCLPVGLKHTCVSYLSRNISVENCLGLLEHAQLYDEEGLAAECQRFISGNLSEFILLNGKELASRKPELLFSLVKDKLPPEGCRDVKVWYRKFNTEKVSLHTLVLPKDACISDAMSELKKQLHKPAKSQLRILGVSNHRIERVFKKKDPISSIGQEESLRAEEESACDQPDGSASYVLHVHHFRTGTWSYEAFGEPFVMNVSFTETVRKVKKRIRARLGVSDDTLESWKFARFPTIAGLSCEYVPPTYLNDNTPMSVLLIIEGSSSSRKRVMMPLGIHHTRAFVEDKSSLASSSSQ